MQIKKQHVKDQIIEISKQEFLIYGYNKTSLRSIAKKMNSTTGVIYTYFSNKEEILTEILKPVLEIVNIFTQNIGEKSLLVNLLNDRNRKEIDEYLDFSLELIFNRKDELKIAYLKSQGSKYEKLPLEFSEYISTGIYNHLKKANPNSHLSKFTTYNLFNFLQNSFKQILIENTDKEKARIYIKELMDFFVEGWIKLNKND